MPRSKGSDELYRLIHSLTTEEKGYFKKFAKRHSPDASEYQKIFDAVNRQKKFEEISLKKKFKDYSVKKAYLFEMILQALTFSAKPVLQNVEMHRQIIYIEVLIQKGLFDKALKIAKKFLKEAEGAENYWLQEQLMAILFRLNRKLWKAGELTEKFRNFYRSIEALEQKKQYRYKLYEMQDLLYAYDISLSFTNKKAFDLKRCIDVRFLEDENNDNMVNIKRTRLKALTLYYTHSQEYEKKYQNTRRLYELEKELYFSNHPATDWRHYMHGIRNHMFGCISTRRTGEAMKLLEEHKKIKIANYEGKTEHLVATIGWAHYIYFESGLHLEGEKYSNQVMQEIDLARYIGQYQVAVLEIYRTKILFEFSNRNYSAMHKTLADFRQLDLKHLAPEHQKFSEFIVIASQVETGNLESVPRLISNLLRSHIKEMLCRDEKTILNILKGINYQNKRQKLKEILQFIDSGGKDELEVRPWIEAHLRGKSLSEIYAEKVKD